MRIGLQSVTRISILLALLLGAGSLASCAHAPRNPESEEASEIDNADSLETFNRAMYGFNSRLDRAILQPVTAGYRAVVPTVGRKMVSNFLDNLNSPVLFVNSVLQGDPQNSFATLWRFMLNTTFGLGGTIDFAGNAGLTARSADFGQTLALYGVESGPYLVLPIMGPSTVRDGVGRAVDMAIDPLTYADLEITIPRQALTVVDWRSRNYKIIEEVNENSIDPYATVRSAWLQKREADIRKAEQSRQKALEQTGAKQ